MPNSRRYVPANVPATLHSWRSELSAVPSKCPVDATMFSLFVRKSAAARVFASSPCCTARVFPPSAAAHVQYAVTNGQMVALW
jgi:hypothetical protein